MVTSSRMLRACSTTTSASITLWSNTSAVSRSTMAVTTGSAWAPMAAMVAMSPARPPAPLGSVALKVITQAGPTPSWEGSAAASDTGASAVMERLPSGGAKGVTGIAGNF